MCTTCLSTSEFVVGSAALAAAAFKDPVHRLLGDLGIVAPPNPVARDARTVAFLRALDLDPVDVLGGRAVEAADAWTGAGAQPLAARRRSSARPIGSHSRLAPQ